MKRAGKHPEKELNALRVRAIKEPGRYPDGGGLYLQVDKSGAKRWLLRVVAQGRRRDIGLGGLTYVSLAEARERSAALRKVAKVGKDPLAEKRRADHKIPTFKSAAEKVHAEHSPSWRNLKHADQWIATLREYVFPVIGSRPVDQIETADVLRVLSPIWLAKPETARRVKQRIRTVLDWARAAGFREGENPVDMVRQGLAKQPARAEHHASLPYSDVPAFVGRLQRCGPGEIGRLAFEFLILTAARTSEVLLATRDELDLEQKVWIIPSARMKAGREHRVPLSARAAEVARRAMELSQGSRFVFASDRSVRKPMSNGVFLMALRRMQLSITAHGFRSAFRDWASEQTNVSREVAEMALAHTIRDKTEAAYRRGDLFAKRRVLMDEWAHYVTGRAAEAEAGEAHVEAKG